MVEGGGGPKVTGGERSGSKAVDRQTTKQPPRLQMDKGWFERRTAPCAKYTLSTFASAEVTCLSANVGQKHLCSKRKGGHPVRWGSS